MRAPLSPRLRLRPEAVTIACLVLLAAPATAGAVVSDVQPIDGPSADVIDVADAAMSEDGTRGHRLPEAGRRARARLRGAVPRRGLGPAAAGRRRPGFDSSWARIGAGDGGRLVVTWVQEFGVESDRHVLGDARPRRRRLPGAGADRLQRRRGDLDLPRPGDEPRRAGLPRLPRRHRRQPVQPARLRRRRRARRPLQRPPLVGARARRSTATSTPRCGCRPTENSPEGRDRRAGRRGRRLAGARRRVRRPGLGAAPVRRQRRHPAPGQPLRPGKGRRCAAPPTPSRSTSPASAQAAVAFRQQPGQASKLDAPRGDGQRDARRLLRTLRQLRRRRCSSTAARAAGSGRRASASIRAASSSAASPPAPRSLLGSGDDVAAGEVERLDDGRQLRRRRPAGRPGRNRRRRRRLARAARRRRPGRRAGAPRRRRGRADRAERPATAAPWGGS